MNQFCFEINWVINIQYPLELRNEFVRSGNSEIILLLAIVINQEVVVTDASI